MFANCLFVKLVLLFNIKNVLIAAQTSNNNNSDFSNKDFIIQPNQPSSNFILKIENAKDYTFDISNQTESCENVQINLSNDDINSNKLGGIIHSASYNKLTDASITPVFSSSCNWRISVPSEYKIELTLVEFYVENPDSNNCPGEYLKISTDNDEAQDDHTASIKLIDTVKNDNFIYENKLINSCELSLKPFTRIETNSNRLNIDLKSSNIVFLLLFRAVIRHQLIDNNNDYFIDSADDTFVQYYDTTSSKSTDLKCNKIYGDMKCETKYQIGNLNYTHYSCVNKDLLCNCPYLLSSEATGRKLSQAKMDNCDYLVETYDDYFKALEQKMENICDYYQKLNTKCRLDPRAPAQHDISLIENDLDDNESDNQQIIINSNNNNNKDSLPYFIGDNQQGQNDICSNVFKKNMNSEFGWLASPNFPTNTKYPPNLNCSFLINMQMGQTVQIRFKYFYLNNNLNTINNHDEIPLRNSNKKKKLSSKMGVLEASSGPNFLNKLDNLDTRQVEHLFNRDYDYLSIYDGSTTNTPLLAKLTAANNDFNKNFNARTFNSKTNHLLIVFHTASSPSSSRLGSNHPIMGFNLTYQVKGLCIEDQRSCNSIFDPNCYSPNQTCNDYWDCLNGADERGCGLCKQDQFRCRNHIFCYRLEDRCDGDHQCIDKSDELNCDKWYCNSDNGTFLCRNGKCVYEQWVCDGTNDCDDMSDELNCPTTFTSRRVITTAVLGGTLCCLLLVMALGCACKLYTLHTIGYRNNIRLSQTVQSAAAAAAAVPLINNQINQAQVAPTSGTSSTQQQTSIPGSNTANPPPERSNFFLLNALDSFRRRLYAGDRSTSSSTSRLIANSSTSQTLSENISNSTTNSSIPNSHSYANFTSNNNNSNNNDTVLIPPVELPMPTHLIAPPTYNQTMGLVDEYEQRHLAFIEQVRSILNQQQQQQNGNGSLGAGTGLINLTNIANGGNHFATMTIIPTVTSSSTTVHRVTSSGSSSRRRSHTSSSRRNRHHRSCSTNIELPNGAPSQPNDPNSISSRPRRSSQRHYSQSNQRSLLHRSQLTGSAQNYDANRRGLAQLQHELLNGTQNSHNLEDITNTNNSNNNTSNSIMAGFSSNMDNLENPNVMIVGSNRNNSTSGTVASAIGNAASTLNPSSSSSHTSTNPNNSNNFNSIINKTSTTSMNLRGKIARLINNIVVHHGDNIQYVQLADQLNSSNNRSSEISNNKTIQQQQQQQGQNETNQNDTNNNNDNKPKKNSLTSQSTLMSHSTATSSNAETNNTNSNETVQTSGSNKSEDDEPLIEP